MAWTASAPCERAITTINLILADARRHVAALNPSSALADIDRTRALALGAMVSVVEDYSQEALDQLAEAGVDANETGKWLWDEVAARAFMSWKSQLSLWPRWGVDAENSQEYTDFDGLIEVRNAAVHGLGELTRVQQRKPNATSRITKTGIAVNGRKVLIDDVALGICQQRAIAFILFLDRGFQAALSIP